MHVLITCGELEEKKISPLSLSSKLRFTSSDKFLKCFISLNGTYLTPSNLGSEMEANIRSVCLKSLFPKSRKNIMQVYIVLIHTQF